MADQAEIAALGESESHFGGFCHIQRTHTPLSNLTRGSMPDRGDRLPSRVTGASARVRACRVRWLSDQIG